MTPAARITSAIEILDTYVRDDVPLDRACDGYFRTRRFIGSSDRRFISQLVYMTIRQQMKLDWWILGAPVTGLVPNARLRVLLTLYFSKQFDLQQLQDLFAETKWGPGAWSDEEKELVYYLFSHPSGMISNEMDDATVGECPHWLLPLIQESLPDHWQAELKALQTEAPVDFRVNTLKTTRDEMLTQLKEKLPAILPTPLSPVGLRLPTRQPFGSLTELTDGLIEVQDEGSQMLSLFCEAKPGMQILDFCAGAGGKSLALAAMMQNKGKIIACDNSAFRLKNAVERFRRAGVHNYELKLLDNDGYSWLKRQAGRYDVVLVDAPCSGTGTWRRNPDLRYRSKQDGLEELVALQAEILSQAAPTVKKGGALVYATCSLLRVENETQVEKFTSKHPFTVQSHLRLSPGKDGTDGFFAARMVVE